jgi:hypothetical protein
LWFLLLTATARAAAPVYDSPEGGFTMLLPHEWEIIPQVMEEYPIIYAPGEEGKGPYVVVTEVDGGTDLFALGDATVKELLRDPLYQLSVRDAFHTADGRVGLKYVLQTPMGHTMYRQVFYFVEGPGQRRFCFMATMSDAEWKKADTDLDNMMKTYHLRAGVTPPTTTGSDNPLAAGDDAQTPATGAAKPAAQLPARVAGK